MFYPPLFVNIAMIIIYHSGLCLFVRFYKPSKGQGVVSVKTPSDRSTANHWLLALRDNTRTRAVVLLTASTIQLVLVPNTLLATRAQLVPLSSE